MSQMKHEEYSTMWKRYHERGGIPRKPLRSFKELCAELGVSLPTMRGKLATHPNAPKPDLKFRSKGSYYEPEAFKAWWRSVNE
jgi:hypothetical protein